MNTVPVNGDSWRNEEWARSVRALGPDERARRIGAAKVLLESGDQISDPLLSELVILLEALEDVGPQDAGPQGAVGA